MAKGNEPRLRAVIGLGNPGPRYSATRHNVGFMVVDELARRAGASWQAKFKARTTKVSVAGADLWLLAPETFMNLSGESAQPFAAFYRLAPEEILVVHDDLDLDFGTLRLKRGGGHGGHNGLRSLIDRLASREFMRLRIGIGRPAKGDVSDWVLSTFSVDERAWLGGHIAEAADIVAAVANDGLLATQNRVHTTSEGR
jgi:PTH1 family peptidyl-tRNA hydrolase